MFADAVTNAGFKAQTEQHLAGAQALDRMLVMAYAYNKRTPRVVRSTALPVVGRSLTLERVA